MVSKKQKRPNETHGHLARGMRTTEYVIWVNMISRCTNEKHNSFPSYGKRGITVCQRWLDSFVAFHADMGNRPSLKHTLDRKDVNGPYEKKNCRWATKKEQSRNMRNNVVLVVGGKKEVLQDAADRLGMKAETLRNRKRLGWSDEDVVKHALVPRGEVVEVERPPSWRKTPRLRAVKRKTDGTKHAAQKRRWAEHLEKGLCVVCSEPIVRTIRCEKHRLEHNAKNRKVG